MTPRGLAILWLALSCAGAVCAGVSCTGRGPYSLGEDPDAGAGGEDADAAPPDASGDGSTTPPILCGEAGVPCNEDEFCDFPESSCGMTGEIGGCLPRPDPAVCPAACNPVCGCDGSSYCNECFAHVAGVDRRLPCP